MEHEWQAISFSFASWTECTCGFRPESQKEMDAHTKMFKVTYHGLA